MNLILQRWGSLVISGLKQADEAVIGTLKEGVHTAVEHQNISVAAGTFALALVLSPTRRLLWRMTLGRFQSAEAAFAAAERRLSSLKETIELQAGETEKLSERLEAARLEYERGLSKLTAAAAEVKRLAAKVEKTDHSAKGKPSKNGLLCFEAYDYFLDSTLLQKNGRGFLEFLIFDHTFCVIFINRIHL